MSLSLVELQYLYYSIVFILYIAINHRPGVGEDYIGPVYYEVGC